MKSNCPWLKTFLWPLLMVALETVPFSHLLAQDDEWEPLMEINGFGYDEIDSIGGYRFYPLCADSFCTGRQDRNYMYCWDFGDGRYSLEAMPIVHFDHHPPNKVTLRVTGIKEVKDPDAREPQIRPTTNNCAVTDSFVGKVELKKAEVPYPDVPHVTFLHPSHLPVAGKCADYLLRFDFAESCKHRGQFSLVGTAEGAGKPWVKIADFKASPGMKVELSEESTLRIDIERTGSKSLYLLLNCKFSDQAKPDDLLHWDIKGKFTVDKPTQACRSVAVAESRTDRFMGSLDPSYLVAGSKHHVRHGDTILWDIKMENEGNEPESYIEVVDTLPMAFDWNSFRKHAVHWGGRDFPVVPELDSAHRVIKWVLNDDAHPLLPGQYAMIQFYVRVDYNFPCPDFGALAPTCDDGPVVGMPVVHRVWTMFHGEQVQGHPLHRLKLEDEVVVSCASGCTPKPRKFVPYEDTRMAGWVTGFSLLLLGMAVGVVLFLVVKTRKARFPRS